MTAKIAKPNGFTLIEALIASLIALIIMAAVVGVFKSTSDTNQTALLRAEVQQNARGALAIMNRDLSQASEGVPPAGIPVPAKAVFACDQTQCYLGGVNYPNSILSPVTPDGLVGANATDAITIAYVDPTWPVTNLPVTVAKGGGAITVRVATFDSNGNPAPPPVGRDYQDTVVGVKVGDVLLLQNNNGAAAITVTGVGGGGVISAAKNDPLRMNNPGADALANKDGSFPPTIASRINVVTYFISIFPPPPTTNGIPVLMRQVGAHPAVPVAEYAQNLQFTYDIFNPTDPTGGPNGTYTAALAAAAVNDSSQIRKVNVSLTLRAKSRDPQGNFHTLTVNSSVSPRDLSFSDRYQ
jgi:prepilin-type N-terminal cleavage/methylation domain-containing protein